MSDDDWDNSPKKTVVGLALTVALGIWIGASGQLLGLRGTLIGWGVWLPVIILYARWKPR